MKSNKSQDQKKSRREFIIMEIKMLVRENLTFCNEKNTPFLCSLKQTEEGMRDIENFCIKAFFETDMDVSEALIAQEKLLNPNLLTD